MTSMHKTSVVTVGFVLISMIYVLSCGPASRLLFAGTISQETFEFVYSPVQQICEHSEPIQNVFGEYIHGGIRGWLIKYIDYKPQPADGPTDRPLT